MSTPRYLAEATTSRVWSCKEYWVGIDDLDLVIRTTWHLPGLNSIFQSDLGGITVIIACMHYL